jgi:hypothetical protein
MRAFLIALPLALAAAPAAAAPDPGRQLPPELSDPAMADKLSNMLGPLMKAMMDMPIGEMQAAIAGREPTPADKSRRVRDAMGGPDAERRLQADLAAAGPQMRAMQKALGASLPALMGALSGMEKELEKATANLPDPTYPKR